MRNEIFCVMFTGVPLMDESRNLLLIIAKSMVDNKKEKQSIKNHEFEGLVSTKWLRRGVGNTFGIQFYAEIESQYGSTQISYIVSLQNFKTEDGEWISIPYSPAFEPYCLN